MKRAIFLTAWRLLRWVAALVVLAAVAAVGWAQNRIDRYTEVPVDPRYSAAHWREVQVWWRQRPGAPPLYDPTREPF